MSIIRDYGLRLMKQQQKGSISSSQKDSKQQKESKSIYGKFKFKDSLARNMLTWSKMDHCLADESAEGLNKQLWKVQVQRFFGEKYFKLVKHGPLSGCEKKYQRS